MGERTSTFLWIRVFLDYIYTSLFFLLTIYIYLSIYLSINQYIYQKCVAAHLLLSKISFRFSFSYTENPSLFLGGSKYRYRVKKKSEKHIYTFKPTGNIISLDENIKHLNDVKLRFKTTMLR